MQAHMDCLNAKRCWASLMALLLCAGLLSACGDGDESEIYEVRPVRTITVEKRAAGEPITEPHDLQRVVQRHTIGQKVVISFVRGGKLRKVTAILS